MPSKTNSGTLVRDSANFEHLTDKSSDRDFLKIRTSQNLRESLKSTYLVGSIEEHHYIKEMLILKEEVLIKKGLLYFVAPAFLLGCLGFCFPYVFAILPSHLCQVCACMFFCREWGHPFL